MLQIDKKKALKKWSPILESLGVNESSKLDWMSEYAEFHSLNEASYTTGVGFSSLSNLSGMGAPASPVVSNVPGGIGSYTMGGHQTGQSGFGNNAAGSGDYGQQLLPVAMKIAAQTIGLDLVAVKPSPGPVIDLMYIDYRYDDGPLSDPNYNPVTFKVNANDLTATKADIDAALLATGTIQQTGGLNKRIFFNLAANPAANAGAGRAAGSAVAYAEPANKEGVIEFLGYSRIDGLPMFRAFRTTNAAAFGVWKFDQSKNTFGQDETIVAAFQLASGQASSAGNITISDMTGVKVELISALEDHIPGFSGGFNRNGAQNRLDDETTYPGVIAPNVSTKRVAVGTVEVSSALKRTEIEDIKSQTGIDIVSKLESVLVNELSQTISKEIIYKLFELGELNRQSAPLLSSVPAPYNTVFDFDVDAYFAGTAPGGETSNSAQRKLLTRLDAASNFIATEGRIGPAQYMVTNAKIAAILKTASGYQLSPIKHSLNANGQMYPVGQIGDITLYVDPYQKYNDDRILLGRKNAPDQPGVIFVPYLMAQSISLISEATFAPRMLLRSRYAVVDVGFFPQKQYMTVRLKDNGGFLS